MTAFLQRKNKPALAYNHSQARKTDGIALVFCGGYRSDMTGTKATYLEQQCQNNGIEYLRFDYSGHGQSEGIFDDCVMSDWINDAQDIINHIITGNYVVVGSSMGGWIGLRLALNGQNQNQLKAFIGIAAAPDFTEDLFEQRLSPDQQKKLFETGIAYVENDYSDTPYRFTKAFYEDGKKNLILRDQHKPTCPIHLIQGKDDKDVPWQTAIKIQQSLGLNDNDITFIDKGDHRLSSPEQLDQTWQIIKKALSI